MSIALHILSDLHLEFSMWKNHKAPQGTDVVILSGDLHPGVLGIIWAERTFAGLPVLIIPGNHEYYGKRALEYHLNKMKDRAAKTANVKVLDRETVIIEGTRFICATLWTDYALSGDQPLGMMQAYEMSDYSEIRWKFNKPIQPIHLLKEHEASVAFIKQELSQNFDGLTVVITHHAPSAQSLSSSERADAQAPCFASNLEPMIEEFQPDLWVHGHIHSSQSYRIGKTLVYSNPIGYIKSKITMKPENPNFKPDDLLELEQRIYSPTI